MRKKLIILLCFFTHLIYAQLKTYNMDEIIVSGSRTPTTFNNLSRSVTILSQKEIEKLPANNFQDLLKYIGGVDLRSRGTEGVQSDISIRGGSFEQTLILIDGVPLIDPQTGHNSLNIPIQLDNIERIEILKGQGTKVFGSNAFSGAINFITKKSTNNSILASALGGENGLYDLSISGSSYLNNSFSIQKRKSDGYRFNTNFNSQMYSFGQNFDFGKNQLSLFLGYVDKSFGANSFYSDRFPNQFERTLTRIANLKADLTIGNLTISPKFYYRNNFDDYHLDFLKQDWNHNTHLTESFGGELQSSFKSTFGTTTFGGEISKDKINSTNLGNHQREKFGLFAEQMVELLNNLTFSAGVFSYKYPTTGWKFWPGVDAAYSIKNIKLFASVGKSFRIPTYTELYYVSPANMGNPNLVYEETINYELGTMVYKNDYSFTITFFMKNGNNLIDWVRKDSSFPWQVENVSDLKTYGSEIEFSLPINNLFENNPIKSVNVNYVYMTSDRKINGLESKYLIDHLQHQLLINISNDLPLQIEQSWSFRYEKRTNSNSNFIIDTQISREIYSSLTFIKITNLFNKSNYDIAGVPLPGRWISAGLKFSITKF